MSERSCVVPRALKSMNVLPMFECVVNCSTVPAPRAPTSSPSLRPRKRAGSPSRRMLLLDMGHVKRDQHFSLAEEAMFFRALRLSSVRHGLSAIFSSERSPDAASPPLAPRPRPASRCVRSPLLLRVVGGALGARPRLALLHHAPVRRARHPPSRSASAPREP